VDKPAADPARELLCGAAHGVSKHGQRFKGHGSLTQPCKLTAHGLLCERTWPMRSRHRCVALLHPMQSDDQTTAKKYSEKNRCAAPLTEGCPTTVHTCSARCRRDARGLPAAAHDPTQPRPELATRTVVSAASPVTQHTSAQPVCERARTGNVVPQTRKRNQSPIPPQRSEDPTTTTQRQLTLRSSVRQWAASAVGAGRCGIRLPAIAARLRAPSTAVLPVRAATSALQPSAVGSRSASAGPLRALV
jgi:hypothetical protein